MNQNTEFPAALRAACMRVLDRHLADRHYRLYLFGSRADGTATPRSDYDLALEPDRPLDNVTLARIRAELERLPVMQRLDFVDLSSASEDFARRVRESCRLLVEQ
ncbi:MAG: nucleotidyltransferase domain-containing protein [Salinisphaera sp.]|nr:nucleotidyltransferase domain-containing protein [Salinisphaera sp.]